MTKSISIITILYIINLSTIISYNINDRFITKTNDEDSMVTWNKTMNSWISLAKMEPCVPILAVKELGCALSTKNTMFKDLFESVCEQHQLCYGCGFAHHLSAEKCDAITLMKMYNICSQNETITFSDCLIQHSAAIQLLRQYTYRSSTRSVAFFYECQKSCVLNYINSE